MEPQHVKEAYQAVTDSPDPSKMHVTGNYLSCWKCRRSGMMGQLSTWTSEIKTGGKYDS